MANARTYYALEYPAHFVGREKQYPYSVTVHRYASKGARNLAVNNARLAGRANPDADTTWLNVTINDRFVRSAYAMIAQGKTWPVTVIVTAPGRHHDLHYFFARENLPDGQCLVHRYSMRGDRDLAVARGLNTYWSKLRSDERLVTMAKARNIEDPEVYAWPVTMQP